MSEASAPGASLALDEAGWRGASAPASYAASPWYAWAFVLVLEAVMAATLVPLAMQNRWGHAALTLLVMATVASPTAARPRWPVKLPVALDLSIAAFIFATLFLGEVGDFYHRFAWWDLLLHGSSGLLFSAVGVLLAYGLERQHGRTELAPRVAFLFAPMFAMSIGTFWEFFEFAVQGISGLPVQVPDFSGPSGLADTMGDLLMNAAGAILVALYGWHTFRPGCGKGMPAWVGRFLAANPRFLVKDR